VQLNRDGEVGGGVPARCVNDQQHVAFRVPDEFYGEQMHNGEYGQHSDLSLCSVVFNLQEGSMKLTSFVTADIHGAIHPYNYIAQQPVNHGLINLKSYIDQYKKDHPDEIVLTVDNGDLPQGDVWSDYDVAHSSAPLIAGHLNDMYDVIGLG